MEFGNWNFQQKNPGRRRGLFCWWHLPESNRGHTDFQSVALPTELRCLPINVPKYNRHLPVKQLFFQTAKLLNLRSGFSILQQEKCVMKRRDFFRHSLMIGAGFTFLPLAPRLIRQLQASPTTSRVVEITNPGMRSGTSLQEKALAGMLDEGIARLFQTDDPRTVWRNLFSQRDVVGIKVNCLSGRHASSHQLLIDLIIERLREAGLPAGNIIIWDRLNQDLESAGYSLNAENRSRIRCFGNDSAGYDNQLYINGSVGSLLTNTITRLCTAIINVPVLKDHGIVGITLSMKNFFGAIHNPNKYHSSAGNPFVADLYEMDIIRRKTRLTICDALDAQYEGGPPYKPQWSWPMNSLLLAIDGVALDRVGWEIIEAKRREKNFPPLKEMGREPRYILTAGEKKLGLSDLDKIEWNKLIL